MVLCQFLRIQWLLTSLGHDKFVGLKNYLHVRLAGKTADADADADLV